MKAEHERNQYYLQTGPHSKADYIGLATNNSVSETGELWHRRLSHRTLDKGPGAYWLPRVSDFTIKRDKTNIVPEEREICSTCAAGRKHKEVSTGPREKTALILQGVYSDNREPMQVRTVTGE